MYFHLVSVYKLGNYSRLNIRMEDGWGPVSPEVVERVFQLMLRTFDSDTGSPDNARVGRPISQTHYNYRLENLERVFQSFETEAFSSTFGRLFDTVLLRLAAYDVTGKTTLPLDTSTLVFSTQNPDRYFASCLLSDFMGRTLRNKNLHPILLRFLKFVARDQRLLKNVMQFGGHMKYYTSGLGKLDDMIVSGYFESLVYDSIFKYGSMELFVFVVNSDLHSNAGAACVGYKYYANVLWHTQNRAPNDTQTLQKLDHVVSLCGGNFLQSPLQPAPAGMPGVGNTGVLQAFLRHEHFFVLPHYYRKSVDIMIYLARACPQALRPQSDDFAVHHTSILHMVAARGHRAQSGEQFERLCAVLLQYATLYDLVDKLDNHNLTIEDYARIHQYNIILDSIHQRRRKLTVCLALHRRLGSEQACYLGNLEPSLISRILDDV